MSRMHAVCVLALAIGILVSVASTTQAGDGYIGIYADSTGTMPCAVVPPYSGTTLYVIAKLEGASSAGITGAEFRIEVENPSGWIFNYSPPAADILMGSALDLNPQDPEDGSGLNIAFSQCRGPMNGQVSFGTISAINISGAPTQLLVKRHSTPSNAGYPCPLFTLCDSTFFSTSCMTPSTDPPCSTLTPKPLSIQSQPDPVVFSSSIRASRQVDPPRGLPLSLPKSLATSVQPSPGPSPGPADIVARMEGYALPSKASAPVTAQVDTLWFADWNFDAGGSCTPAGWTKADNRTKNDGTNYWYISEAFAGTYGTPPSQAIISGNAAVLGVSDSCFVSPLLAGYANDRDYAIRIQYRGDTQLLFHIVVDTEAYSIPLGQVNVDAVTVELDSACSCCDVDYELEGPTATAEDRRKVFGSTSLGGANAGWYQVPLDDFDSPNETHCALIRFTSNRFRSPQDRSGHRLGPWYLGAAVVVDNTLTVGGDPQFAINETFDNWTGDCNQAGTVCFINSADNGEFGEWARTFPHVTDNDVCAENQTCSWLFTDNITPTIFNDASTSYGPGGFVIKNWLDDVVMSPWVSIEGAGFSLRDPIKIVLSFREFGGNAYQTSRIGRAWSVRGKKAGGCLPESWANESIRFFETWNILDKFDWATEIRDITNRLNRDWTEVQVRFRISDLRLHYIIPDPLPLNSGPGPYIDHVRLGKVSFPGPVIIGLDDERSRWQAQDAFPTQPDPQIGGAGDRFSPTTDRFGSTAFSPGMDIFWTDPVLHPPGSPRSLVISPGDSILVEMIGSPEHPIQERFWYGAIVAGPHAGKAPPPLSVGANGFFSVTPDSVREEGSGAVLENYWFVDLDDTYFRGGDVLKYFWAAIDDANVFTSAPFGLTDIPTSVEQAENVTGGLMEVNFLPTIEWAPAYLARIAADPHGDLAPTSPELSGSSQERCILYVNKVNPTRRSGDANRTSFMYTLDRLGYRDKYDVYDVMGPGNANNDLSSRAAVEQAQGYALIIHDTGRGNPYALTQGECCDQRADQAAWYRIWLRQGVIGEVNTATLWLIGEDLVEQRATNPLLSTDVGATLVQTDQGLTVNPNVRGVASMSFDLGTSTNSVAFSGDEFSLNGGCPSVRDYDGLGIGLPTAVITHKYQHPGSFQLGAGAVVMNKNAAENWNTIVMSFPWFDVVPFFGTQPQPETPTMTLAGKILGGVLPVSCLEPQNPSDAPEGSEPSTPPIVTALHQNVPNPFNPTTNITFDLGLEGHAELQVFDVGGRLVRTLVNERMPSQRHRVVWDGLDDRGRPVSSGLYFYRLRAAGYERTRKLVVLR